MKADIFGKDGKKAGSIDLPIQFEEPVRKDLIKRAILAIASHLRQPYGADPWAGTRTSAEYRGRRKSFGTWANRGMHRIARIRIGSGYQTGTARLIPGVVKGRKAHPPKAEKNWEQQINAKERKKAIRSAIAATGNTDIVMKRNHLIGELKMPIIADDSITSFTKTKDALNFLLNLGLAEEMQRTADRKVRAGRGTMRGRKYKTKKGPLVVVADDKQVSKAFKGMSGVDVVSVRNLNTNVLAPGAAPGRLTVWTKGAIEAMEKNKLFM